MSDEETLLEEDGGHERSGNSKADPTPRKIPARKRSPLKIRDIPPEEMDAIADEYISGLPYVQRHTIRKKIEGLRESIIQRRKDGQNIVDIALGYKNAFDSYLPSPVSLSYVIKLVSEVSKEAFLAKNRPKQQKAKLPDGESLGRPPNATTGSGTIPGNGQSVLEEVRRHAEERARSGGKPSPFPPGYREKSIEEL